MFFLMILVNYMLPVLARCLLHCHRITHALGRHKSGPVLGLTYTVYSIIPAGELGFLRLTNLTPMSFLCFLQSLEVAFLLWLF